MKIKAKKVGKKKTIKGKLKEKKRKKEKKEKQSV